MAAVLAVGALAALAWWQIGGRQVAPTENSLLAMPSGPVLAVMPFENLGPDSGDDWFADGLTDELITALQRAGGVSVVSRGASFSYKGWEADVRDIAVVLAAEYVLQGSVRRGTDTLAVTAWLRDARGGGALWQEEMERPLFVGAIYAIRDRITASVLEAIAAGTAPVGAAAPTQSLAAYDCVLRARHAGSLGVTAERYGAVIRCLEETVAAEPGYADAWAWLAALRNEGFILKLDARPGSELVAAAATAAERALAIDAANQPALVALTFARFFAGELDAVAAPAARAVAANPAAAEVYSVGMAVAFAGDWETGLAYLARGMRIDPTYPRGYHFAFVWDHYRHGRYDQALAEARRIAPYGDHMLAAAFAVLHVRLGRRQRAEAALAKALRLDPAFADQAEDIYRLWLPSDGLADAVLADLRQAGL